MARVVSTADAQIYPEYGDENDSILPLRPIPNRCPADIPDAAAHSRARIYTATATVLKCANWLALIALVVLGVQASEDVPALGFGLVYIEIGEWLPQNLVPGTGKIPLAVLTALGVIVVAGFFAADELGRVGREMLSESRFPTSGLETAARNSERRVWLWSASVAAGFAGAALCIAPIQSLPLDGDLKAYFTQDFPPAAIGLVMIAVAFALADWANQLLPDPNAMSEAGCAVPPVLLFRSSLDGNLEIVGTPRSTDGKGRSVGAVVRWEQAIGDIVRRLGPLVTISRHGEYDSLGRSTRSYRSDIDRHESAARWMERARLILLVPGPSNDLGREIAEIERSGHFHKVAIVLPAAVVGWQHRLRALPIVGSGVAALVWMGVVPDDAAGARMRLRVRWSEMRKALSHMEAFDSLPADPPEGAVVVLLDRDMRPMIVVGPYRPDDDHYAAAIHLAFANMRLD